MEINKIHYYLYGRYNLDVEGGAIIIYREISPLNNRTIASLEGFFVSNESIIKKGNVDKEREFVFGREKMGEIEKKYEGKFLPFKSN